jgi:hypothetical protein
MRVSAQRELGTDDLAVVGGLGHHKLDEGHLLVSRLVCDDQLAERAVLDARPILRGVAVALVTHGEVTDQDWGFLTRRERHIPGGDDARRCLEEDASRCGIGNTGC